MVEQKGASGEKFSILESTITGLEDEVNNHRIHNNPFLEEIGLLDEKGLSDFLKQQCFISSSFSQDVSAVFSRIPKVKSKGVITPAWEVADPLFNVMQYERWGSRDRESRSSKYINLMSHLGVFPNDLFQAKALPSTAEFVALRSSLCKKEPLLTAVSGLGFMELAVGKIYKRYMDGVKKVSKTEGFEYPLDYFIDHVNNVRKEYDIYKNILLALGPSQKNNASSQIAVGAMSLLDARDRWYTDLSGRFSHGKS